MGIATPFSSAWRNTPRKLFQMMGFVVVGFGVGAWYYEARVAKLRREIELLDLMGR